MRLIDADKVLERAYQMNLSATITDGSLALVDYLLSAEPTVYPVKHGRWNEGKFGDVRMVQCSACEEWTTFPSRYCPNCGSEMG